jgi:predicted Rossmann fold nucleotide-binding protein DprA/Smf involved in DNA uptake
MPKSLLSFWQRDEVFGVGNAGLLKCPLTAFFASRRCSGRAIRAAMDWAVEQARTKTPLIGGFHSPLEQSVLEVMLSAHAPVVIVIVRKLETAQLPPAWLEAAQAGTVAVVSMEESRQRLTTELATRRNHWIARHAAHVVVAEAAPGGSLASCLVEWKNDGKRASILLDEVGN